MPQCKFIKPNGQRCRHRVKPGQEYCYNHHPDRQICAQPGCTKTAMTGLSYCQFHRKDGIPRAGFAPGHKTNRLNPNSMKTGFSSYPLTLNMLVDTIIRLELLLTYADTVEYYIAQLEADEKIHQLKAYRTQGRTIRLGPNKVKQLKLF